MSDPVTGPAATPPPAAPVAAPTAAAAAAPATASPPVAVPVETPSPLASTDTGPAAPRLGSAPARGVDWGRVGIAAGFLPLAYGAGVMLHEVGGHGTMVAAQGGDITEVHPLPHTYTRPDGSTGLRFGAISYREGADWGPRERALVSLGPSILDTTLIAAGTTLYETGNWPRNPWASGALFALQTAVTVDLGFNGIQGLVQAENGSVDSVKAAHALGVSPYVVGGIQTGIAVAGAVELVRIGLDVFRTPAPADPARPTVNVSATPAPGGGSVQISGTF